MIAAVWLVAAAAAACGASPVDAEVRPVIDLFYDLQLERAREAADRIAGSHPGHPAGPFYASVVAYQRFLADEGGRDAALQDFERLSRKTIDAATVWISTDAAESYYYLGAAHGFRARVLAARRKYLRALPEALRGVKQLKRALAVDPTLEDAYLGLGMYHYFRARMPAAAKPFAFLLTGEGSDAERGLDELRRAADKAPTARMEARSVLASIYASDRERRWDEAEPLLAELMERYPHNPLYRLRRVYAAERRGRFQEAAALADPDGAWADGLEPALRRPARAAALYRAAEAALLSGRPDEARRRLDALDALGCPDDLKAWAARRRAELASGKAKADPKPWTGLEAPR